MDDLIARLDQADEALTNLDGDGLSAAFESCIEAARAAINAARAIAEDAADTPESQ